MAYEKIKIRDIELEHGDEVLFDVKITEDNGVEREVKNIPATVFMRRNEGVTKNVFLVYNFHVGLIGNNNDIQLEYSLHEYRNHQVCITDTQNDEIVELQDEYTDRITQIRFNEEKQNEIKEKKQSGWEFTSELQFVDKSDDKKWVYVEFYNERLQRDEVTWSDVMGRYIKNRFKGIIYDTKSSKDESKNDVATQEWLRKNEYVYVNYGMANGTYVFRESDDVVFAEDIDSYILIDDANYCEENDRYFYDIDRCEDWIRRNTLSDYHCMQRLDLSKGADVTIGFEIEKNDMFDTDEVKTYKEEYEENKIILERDGSVDEGFELITPTLDINNAVKFFEKAKLKRFTEIEDIDNAGGHISIGMNGQSGSDVARYMRGWMGMIHAIWEHRLDNSYCEPSPFDRITRGAVDSKGSAIVAHSQRLEFRVVDAVENYKQLVWRAELFKIIMSYKKKTTKEVIKLLRNEKSRIARHLQVNQESFKFDDRFIDIVKRENDRWGFDVVIQQNLEELEDVGF